ncbi:hypothetical protein BT67DRAFT_192771 [Trichocladium antarcticum]|uniref:Uncharacterized protein n=1 Tax=Trichocladium antarcticum TaxID=1450529 RepID=A0AAN6ZGN3_9PEZI|nr:hypothetical protein BT67DRAFT_192771 [Trichocladium antarcticum]
MMQRRTDRNTLVARIRCRYWNGAAWEFDCCDATLGRPRQDPRSRGQDMHPLLPSTKTWCSWDLGAPANKTQRGSPEASGPLNCREHSSLWRACWFMAASMPGLQGMKSGVLIQTTSAFRGLQSTDDRHGTAAVGRKKKGGRETAETRSLSRCQGQARCTTLQQQAGSTPYAIDDGQLFTGESAFLRAEYRLGRAVSDT